jgi:DNA-binding NtrC family response regulator
MIMTKKTILIIDHNSDTIDFIKDRLESQNYEVITANNIFEGIKLLYSMEPNVILLEEELFNGCDPEVIREIIWKLPETKIILMAVSHSKEQVKRALDLGVHGYFFKPFGQQELCSTIERVLSGSTIQDS